MRRSAGCGRRLLLRRRAGLGSTIGYGDINVMTAQGRQFTIAYSIVAMWVFGWFSDALTVVLERRGQELVDAAGKGPGGEVAPWHGSLRAWSRARPGASGRSEAKPFASTPLSPRTSVLRVNPTNPGERAQECRSRTAGPGCWRGPGPGDVSRRGRERAAGEEEEVSRITAW